MPVAVPIIPSPQHLADQAAEYFRGKANAATRTSNCDFRCLEAQEALVRTIVVSACEYLDGVTLEMLKPFVDDLVKERVVYWKCECVRV